jgi:hypothetical protein
MAMWRERDASSMQQTALRLNSPILSLTSACRPSDSVYILLCSSWDVVVQYQLNLGYV